MVAKTVATLLATMGDRQPEKSQGSIIMSVLHSDYLSWAEFTLVWEFSCKGGLGNAWWNAFSVYILSVCTKLDVYLQCILGKWFLLGSTSGRLQAYVALALGFASSSCLRTWGKVFHVAGTKVLPHSIRLFFHSPTVAGACLHESSNYRTCILEHMSHGLSLIWHTYRIRKALPPTNYGVRTEDGAWGSCHNSLTARPSLM